MPSRRSPAPPAADPLLSLPASLQALAQRGERRRYRARQVLIQEGDQGETIYLILQGRLRAYSLGDKDREITYGVYGPGEYLGEMSLDGGPRSANVETLEASECVVITRRSLTEHIAQHPEFAFELLAKVIRRARAATLSARQMALNDVYGRLKALLEGWAGPADAQGCRQLSERPTHRELSHQLGCSREMVSRLMKDLERGGYVRSGDGCLELCRALPPQW